MRASVSRGQTLLRNVHTCQDRAHLLFPAANSLPCPQQWVPTFQALPTARSLPTSPTAQGGQSFLEPEGFPDPGIGNRGRGREGDVGSGLTELLPSPSSGGEVGPQSWGLGLPLALGLDLKEKRLIRRREKLPAFFRTLGVAIVLERSSWDWLRPASFCRGLRRKMSLVPLRRKLTVEEEGKLRQRDGHTGREGWAAEKGTTME